jgi:hypothetical protein
LVDVPTFEGKNRGAVMRKVVGASIALGAMVAAAASQPGIEAARVAAVDAGVRKAATATAGRLGAACDGFLAAIAERGQNAAALPQLRAQLALLRDEGLDGPLGNTLRDFFHVEKDWERWRQEFPVSGISIEGTGVDLLVGAPSRSFSAGALIERARRGDRAADFLLAADLAHAAAAARVTVPGREIPPVLLLARPIDDGVLADLGKRAGAALILSNGKQGLARTGDAAVVQRLGQAIGHEADSSAADNATDAPGAVGLGTYKGDEGAWAATVRPLATGFWLLAFSDTAEVAREAAGTARNTRVIVWSAGALIGLLSLFIGFRRGGAAGALGLLEAEPGITTNLGPAAAAARDRNRPGLTPVVEETTPTPLSAQLPSARPIAAASSPAPSASPLPSSPLTARDQTTAGLAPIAVSPLRPFGRYVLLSQLGEGGMARVYTAVVFGAEGFRRKFVVKRLRPELVEDQTVVAQFIDEANMASSLVHSNIVPVLDFGKVDDEYFLATEYILGRDLGRLTNRCLEIDRRGLPADVVLFIAQEVLKALEYAHGKTGENGQPLGLVHRDVSPGNVLVSARGEVKLFDFGIVKAEGRVTRTQQGVVKGNVSFMSPEQARGTEVDVRADLFSLGLVMYTCLTGRVLYGGNTTYELLVKAATGPGPEETALFRALPSPLGALIEKALAVDPKGRFQNAGEFLAAVAPHVGHGGGDLAELMARLFSDDFRQEEAAFSSAAPPPAPSSGVRADVAPGRSS